MPFRQLLDAGTARRDKGFGLIVDVVPPFTVKNAGIPIAGRTRPNTTDVRRHDAEDIARLKRTK